MENLTYIKFELVFDEKIEEDGFINITGKPMYGVYNYRSEFLGVIFYSDDYKMYSILFFEEDGNETLLNLSEMIQIVEFMEELNKKECVLS